MRRSRQYVHRDDRAAIEAMNRVRDRALREMAERIAASKVAAAEAEALRIAGLDDLDEVAT